VQDVTGVRINEEYQTKIRLKVSDQAGEFYFQSGLKIGLAPARFK
jgi:hypothetical protein